LLAPGRPAYKADVLLRASRAAPIALALALALPRTAWAGVEPGTPTRTLEVRDAGDTLVARVVVRSTVQSQLHLAPGRYRVLDAATGTVEEIEVDASGILVLGGDRAAPRVAPTSVVRAAPEPASTSAARTSSRPRKWTRWGAPLFATFIPGLGHGVAGRPGPGFGIFAGAAGLLFGSIALGRANDGREGATRGDAGRSVARETARELAFVAFTDTLALLWIGQIADAWVVATGHRVRGRIDHVVSLGFTRSTAVGIRPGEPAIDRYDDWTIQLLGQVAPRVLFGLADLGVHLGPRGQVSVQGGLRVAVRAVQRDRFWLVPAAGLILQGTSGRSSVPPIEGGAAERERGRFAAVPYLQLEHRIFVLDRLSLDVTPRFSVPLGPRYYGRGAAIPRWAPTFELAVGPTVYF